MTEEIYSSVPIDNLQVSQDFETKKYNLIQFLKEHRGRFFKAKQLSEKFGFKSSNTQVELRYAITQAVEGDLLPIVANPKGFSYADHKAMILFYIEALESRKKGLDRRINSLREIYHKSS